MCHVDRMYGHVLPAALIPRPHISLLCPSPLPVQLSGLGHLRDPFSFLSCPAARIAGLGHLNDPFPFLPCPSAQIIAGLGHLRDPFPFLPCPSAQIAGLGHLSDPFLLAGVEQTVAMLDQRLEAQVRVVDGGSMKPHLYPA